MQYHTLKHARHLIPDCNVYQHGGEAMSVDLLSCYVDMETMRATEIEKCAMLNGKKCTAPHAECQDCLFFEDGKKREATHIDLTDENLKEIAIQGRWYEEMANCGSHCVIVGA